MKKIAVLDRNTIDKIAAGEVVERPASVVKELVENAIDAGATAITVEIKEGGISFIRITDNGGGMDKEQVPMAFLRHATSKIEKVEDLLEISSLGFRGEALSSISAVAQVELITKTPEDLTGIRYIIEGGMEKTLEDIGAPGGTTIIVRNLFFNTPARAKFLKTAMTEGGYVSTYMEQLALSHQDISFKYIVNGQTKLHSSGNANLRDVIYGIYGRDITRELVPVEYENKGIHIQGFAGKPLIARGNRTYENYYVNGRYVKSKILMKAIEDAYKPYMMQHKYPFVCLHYTVPGDAVDINVHPTKMEVRFQDQQAVYQATFDALKSSLEHREMIPEIELVKKEAETQKPKKSIPEPFEIQRKAAAVRDAGKHNMIKEESVEMKPRPSLSVGVGPAVITEHKEQNVHTVNKNTHSAELNVHTVNKNTHSAELNVHTVNKNTQTTEPSVQTAYKNTQTADSSVHTANKNTQPAEPSVRPVDKNTQSAEANVQTANKSTPSAVQNVQQIELFDDRLLSKKAREKHRIIGQLFDTYWLVEYEGKFYIIDQHAAHEKVLYERFMKELKNREIISQMVSPPEILTLNLQEDALMKEHQDIFREFGFEISPFGGREYSISAVPSNLYGVTVQELFVEILDSLETEGSRQTPDIITHRIATAACKAAVKGNQMLSCAEADNLIDELLGLENPYHCPHGRPTIVSMTKYELEKKFKRIV